MDRVKDIFEDEARLVLCPAVQVSFLRANGLLHSDKSGRLQWSWFSGGQFRPIDVIWNATTSHLTIQRRDDGELLLKAVVEHIRQGRQSQTFILDPKTGERCNTLYFVDGVIGSRKAFGIPYPSRRLTPAMRRELEIQQPHLRWPQPRDPDLEQSADLASVSMQSPIFQDRWSTACALEEGRQTWAKDPDHCEHFLDDQLVAAIGEPVLPLPLARPWPADDLEVGIWEQQPRLDYFELRRAGLIVDGQRRYATLSYSHDRAKLSARPELLQG